MLRSWLSLFSTKLITSADIIKTINGSSGSQEPFDQQLRRKLRGVKAFKARSNEVQILRDSLYEFNDRATDSAKSLGKVLKYRVDRIVGGLRLEKKQDKRTNTNRWRVVEVV